MTVFGDDITFENSFKKVDDVLYNATRGISDIITKRGKVNVDFADVKTIMRDMGDALMGIGYAKGEDKAVRATGEAIDNPLLEGVSIKGAKSILMNIIADNNFKIADLKKMTELIRDTAGEYGKLIWGVVTDDRMEDEIIVTLIATGFNIAQQKQLNTYPASEDSVTAKNMLIDKRGDTVITKIPTTNQELEYYDIPTVQRKNLLQSDEVKQIRAKNEEYDMDLDFNTDDLKIANDDKPAFLRRQMD